MTLYNTFAVASANSNTVTIRGYSDAELEHPESNLVFAIYQQLCRANGWSPVPFALTNNNDIPLYGGIGSSAAAIVAAIAIAGRIHQARWDKDTMLHIAFGFESHLDNIAAAIFGGFVVTSHSKDRKHPLVVQKSINTPLCAWLLVPHLRVATSASRIAMPQQISYDAAVFNLAHAAQLALAFERQDWQLLGACMQDKLHQPYRKDSCAGMLTLAADLQQAGAYAMALSGSGPAVLVLCKKPTKAMQQCVAKHMQQQKIEYSELQLGIDNQGVRYS